IENISEKKRFSVVSCTSDQEALEMLTKEAFDIVIAEHLPPRMDGIALLRAARLIAPHLPFIFFTGSQDEELPIDALNNGADHYIRKKRDPKSLSSSLAEAIFHAVRKIEAGRDLRENIRCIAEHCTDLIIVTDPDGEIVYVSPSSMTMLGYAPEEFPGAVLDDDLITGREIARMAGDGEEDRERAHEAGRENRVRKRDGAYATLDVRGSPLYAGSAFQGTLVIARDVTHLKREEERLRDVNKRLALISSVTRHDILNQVAVLVGYLELLGEDLEDRPDLADVLKIIETATRKIEQQITSTRDYEKIGIKAPCWQNVRDVLGTAIGFRRIDGAEVLISTGTLEVYADQMLHKAFSSLIDNAVRHAGAFTTISVTFRTEGSEGIITFRDNGVGVPDAIKERIFSRGFGSDAGFGLYLTREILDITGISIAERGEAGTGACFEIRLPAGTWRC
ncbi:MAG TPA: PAS domain S-box protein, partial [Methanofollis liminatans]|nr:PAS domain S-box protein [Methanofollis liminatans]